MKPVFRSLTPSFNHMQSIPTGPIIAIVKGSVKKLGLKYRSATIVLYNKSNLLPILIQKPSPDGDYVFLGLNTNLETFVVAFDENKKFNAVIQDNVVPK